jgi:glycosyltransferase involved in cell wall biosynthesis
MIVKNEESNLPKCLDSVKDLVDEINIVDTGSTDRTIEIASQYTDRIFTFEWIDDFSAARNFSFSKATKEYIMWLDADDVITEENRDKFKKMKEVAVPSIDVVFMTYNYYYDEKENLNYTHVRERILKRSCGFTWVGNIHEHIEINNPTANSIMSDVVINHTRYNTNESSERNKRMIRDVIESGKATRREKFYHALFLKQDGKNEESLKWYNEFLDDLGDDYFECIDGLIDMHDIYIQKGEPDKALAALLDNESLGSDMSEFYCALGDHYRDVEHDNWKAAASYEKALTCEGMMRNLEIPAYKKDIYYYSVPLRSLGKCQLKMNQFSEALTSYKRARVYNRKDQVLKDLCDRLEKLVDKIGA